MNRVSLFLFLPLPRTELETEFRRGIHECFQLRAFSKANTEWLLSAYLKFEITVFILSLDIPRRDTDYDYKIDLIKMAEMWKRFVEKCFLV